jgi:hypothetical protein
LYGWCEIYSRDDRLKEKERRNGEERERPGTCEGKGGCLSVEVGTWGRRDRKEIGDGSERLERSTVQTSKTET